MRQLLRVARRLARWTGYADCTCREVSVLDCDHDAGCAHPLRRVPPRPAQTRSKRA